MEHLIGKGIDTLIRLRHSRKIKTWKAGSEPFTTSSHLRRFTLLASMIAAREVRVVDISGDTPPRPYLPLLQKLGHHALLPEHGFSWTDGEKIFLPLSFVDMPAPGGPGGQGGQGVTGMEGVGAQETLARITVFFHSCQIRYDSIAAACEKRALLEGDRAVADLYWIVENARLTGLLKKDFPGMVSPLTGITRYLLTRRPGKNHLNQGEKAVEGILLETLSGKEPYRSASATESLALAVEIKEGFLREGVSFRRYRAVVPFTPWGKLIPGRLKANSVIAVGEAKETETASGSHDKNEEQRERRRYAARKEVVDEDANEQGLALNIYDKLLSWAEFVNVNRPFDDDPEDPGDKPEESEELATADLRRTGKNFLNADLEKEESCRETASNGDNSGKTYLYPEWDFRKGAYRKAHSRVTETEAVREKNGFLDSVLDENRSTAKKIRRQFEMLNPTTRLVTRQLEGDIIDIDAAVEAAVDLEAGLPPGEKLYARYKRTERDISVLFLVDLSMSTDSWVGKKRVIDHEKEALVLLSDAIERLGDGYAVYGFSGKGRTGCSYYHVKGFDERYTEAVRQRISGLVPHSYTRMGPAIRHSVEILRKRPSRIKLLFILSDGKPNDVDVYEGRYGLEDTRMAVKESERAGVIPFCLTLDTNAREYLPHLFGQANHAVVPGAEKLAATLPMLYARIINKL